MLTNTDVPPPTKSVTTRKCHCNALLHWDGYKHVCPACAARLGMPVPRDPRNH